MPESLDQVRERLEQELRSQAEQIRKLEGSLLETRRQHEQLQRSVHDGIEALRAQPPAAAAGVSLDQLLRAVENLARANSPENVFKTLVEESPQSGVRLAVFTLRGNKAACSFANGFSADRESLSSLLLSLDSEEPFRRVVETGGHVETDAAGLKNRDLLRALQPSAAAILLQAIRAGGSVAAILYGDSGEGGGSLPVEALRILAEFASAQLDRLSAIGAAAQPRAEAAEAGPAPAAAERPVEEQVAAAPVAAAAVERPLAETPAPPPANLEAPPAPPAAFSLEQLSEADQRVHKDARRFSRLLVSEIELYNKTKVAEGRRNRDLYKRLKTDIERSRQTYQKRFGHTVANRVDYFHDELVRSLAQGDPSLLGSDYPGPVM